MSTLDDGAQRITWVKSTITTVLQKEPAGSYGLWSFGTSATEQLPAGPLSASIGGTERSSAITAALNALKTEGDSYTYGAIRTALTTAAAGDGTRLIVLTDGADSTPGLSRSSIKATVAEVVGRHPGSRLDVVGLSPSVNHQALTEIAAAGGGRFAQVDTLADLEPTLLALSS